MPLLNYTTSIHPHKTVMEIQAILATIGAAAIMTNFDKDGNIVALSFQITLEGQTVSFKLPTDWKPVHETLQRQRVARSYQTPEQALRVAWRITKDWIEAQAAIVETRMVTPVQVFLPYAITKQGNTLYEHVAQNSSLLLGDGSNDH